MKQKQKNEIGFLITRKKKDIKKTLDLRGIESPAYAEERDDSR
jgi:hypothetical protein